MTTSSDSNSLSAQSVLAAWDASSKSKKQASAEATTEQKTIEESAPATSEAESVATATQTDEKPESLLSVDKPESDKDSKTQTHDWEKRYKDLQSHSAKQVNEKESEIAKLKSELEKASKAPVSLPKTEEDLTRFKQQHPELYDTLFTMIRLEASKESEELSNQFKELKEAQEVFKREAAKQEGRKELMKIHSDAFEILETQAFKDWYSTSSQGTQALFNSDHLKDVVNGFNIYKSEMGLDKKLTRSEEKALAALAVDAGPSTPPTVQEKKTWRESEIKKMSPREFKANEKDIDLAMREGRFVRDLSAAS